MLVQLSDPHVHRGPGGDAAVAALRASVDAVLAFPVQAEAVLVSGDLTDTGDPDEYALVRELLAPLPMPVHAIPGNHDDRAAFRSAFGAEEEARCGGLRLVLCDTTIPGQAGGHLDVAWLAERLAADTSTPTIVAMHHAPLHTGIPYLDAIGLPVADRAGLAELLARSPQVLRVVCGHVHRLTFETLGGCGVLTAPSTHLQAEPSLEPPGLVFVPEGRGFLLHHLRGGDLVSHFQPV